MATIEQSVKVAKDRALDELACLHEKSYFHNTPEERERIQAIGRLLGMPDDFEQTLKFADKLHFINGDEDEYLPF